MILTNAQAHCPNLLCFILSFLTSYTCVGGGFTLDIEIDLTNYSVWFLVSDSKSRSICSLQLHKPVTAEDLATSSVQGKTQIAEN